jgi:hypothetical protein
MGVAVYVLGALVGGACVLLAANLALQVVVVVLVAAIAVAAGLIRLGVRDIAAARERAEAARQAETARLAEAARRAEVARLAEAAIGPADLDEDKDWWGVR